jgi:hypothetical protein
MRRLQVMTRHQPLAHCTHQSSPTKRSRAIPAALGALSLAVAFALGGSGCASAVGPGVHAAAKPLAPNPEFAAFPRYDGTLGGRRIVLRLGRKTDDETGVHGEYQFVDTGEVVLVAGDITDGTVEVEESNDGTAITGNWVGRIAADGSIAAERMNVDDSDPQPVALHPRSHSEPSVRFSSTD